jgi:ketosteroid isomerase-like protein
MSTSAEAARRQQRKDAALRFLGGMADGDAAALRTMLADDARWWVPPSVEGRVARPLDGADAVARLAGGVTTSSFRPGTTTWHVLHVTAEEDRVSVLAQRHAVGANGRAYENDYHWLFRFAGDLIAEIWEVLDTSHAFVLLTLDPDSWTD